jgi:GrpB-like predicted nucleotidyltransferase (UPF0157 family)
MNDIEMNDQENSEDPFEDGLRQILSSNASVAKGYASAQTAAAKRKRDERMEAERAEAEKLAEAERKLLFWLKLMRPVAFAALLGLMALFVHIIVTWGN